MPDKFQNTYRIPSARLSNWDYSSNAAYFITICTANRECYFGEIINEKMQLSGVGEFVNECWMNIPNHFPYFYLDAFIVMPNHVHGIVMIEKPYVDNNKRFDIADTGHALSAQNDLTESKTQESISKTPHFRFRNQGKNTISAMVGSLKSVVTKKCNQSGLRFKWQQRFHDHIIRDKDEFLRIRNYIVTNPENWQEDKFYSL